MRLLKWLMVSGLVLLAACSRPLPAERADYAGIWEGPGMMLAISAGGEVSYRRVDGGVTTQIDAPIKEFRGHDFVVGLGMFTTTFEVSVPPHVQDGAWQMTVDGVALRRRAGPLPPTSAI